MEWWQIITAIIVPILGAVGLIASWIHKIMEKYKQPFLEMQQKIDDLAAHQPQCAKYFAADKETLESHTRELNRLARRQEDAYAIIAKQSEGIYLCMQHEVKGNHIELLEQWMRDNARTSISKTY